MNERLKVYLAYTAVCTIWGSTWLVIKIGLESLTPLIASGCRFLVASSILLGLIVYRGVKIPFGARERLLYLSVALTSFSFPFALVYWGEQYIPSGLTSIIFAIYPFIVAFFSLIFLPSQRPTASAIVGITLAFLGIVAIFSNDIQATDPHAMWAMAAVFCSAVLQGFSLIIIKKHGQSIHHFVVTFVPMLTAAILLLAGGLLFEDLTQVHFTGKAILSICYLAVFGSVTTFVSYFWLLKKVEAVLLSLTSFVTPIIAVVLGVVLLGEELSPRAYLGAAMVLAGIAAANFTELRKLIRKSGLRES